MTDRTGSRIFCLLATLAVAALAGGCGGAAPTAQEPAAEEPAGQESAAQPSPTSGPALPDEPTLIPELATASAMTCAPPATEIGLGEAVRAEIAASAQSKERKYFCVQVPPGVSGLSIEVSDATADLNLFAAFPDLETLQQGGVWFWSADDPGTGDKTLVIEPAGRDTVNAGPYYIEVSAEDAGAASFTLTVRIREPE